MELPTPLPVFDALAPPDRGRLGAATEAELGEDVGEVVLRSAGADHEALGDLSVRASLGQEVEDLAFSASKPRSSSRPRATGHGAQSSQKGGRSVGVRQCTEPIERRDGELAFPNRRSGRRLRERASKFELCPGGLERQAE